MAGLNVASSGGGRRSVDAELALVPMIDLLVCCITFLLLTAAWSLMHRMPASSQVGGPPAPCASCTDTARKLSVKGYLARYGRP